MTSFSNKCPFPSLFSVPFSFSSRPVPPDMTYIRAHFRSPPDALLGPWVVLPAVPLVCRAEAAFDMVVY